MESPKITACAIDARILACALVLHIKKHYFWKSVKTPTKQRREAKAAQQERTREIFNKLACFIDIFRVLFFYSLLFFLCI